MTTSDRPAEESPFEPCAIMDGYPLNSVEQKAVDKVLADLYERQPELRPRRRFWQRPRSSDREP